MTRAATTLKWGPGRGWTPQRKLRARKSSSQRSRREKAARAGAFVLSLSLHGLLLIFWRSSNPPRSAVLGLDGGGGGAVMSVSLARLGVRSAPVAPDHGSDANTTPEVVQPPPSPAPSELAPAQTASAASAPESAQASASAQPASSATFGGLGQDGADQPNATAGRGYDPFAYASLAPPSLGPRSEPGFFEQARPCLKKAAVHGAALQLAVQLDEHGRFVGARTVGAGAGAPNAAGGVDGLLAQVGAALAACAPYRVAGADEREISLLIPASAGAEAVR